MSRETRFGKMLDRSLCGQKVEAEGEDAELLAFASRLSRLKRPPAPEYKARLKSQLLQKLDARAVKNVTHGWVWQLFSRPVAQAALVFAVILITGTSLWAAGVFNRTAAPVPTVLKVVARTDKEVYDPGETILITVSLQNITQNVLTMAEFPPILSLMRSEDKQAAYTFQSGSATEVIEPGQAAFFTRSWNQAGDSGQQVVGGRYYIELEDLYYQGSAVKLALAKPVEFTIR